MPIKKAVTNLIRRGKYLAAHLQRIAVRLGLDHEKLVEEGVEDDE
jgi:hypothetical protein